MQEEQWKTIEGYPDYAISTSGRVKSLKRKHERVMSPIQINGYSYVSLSSGGRQTLLRIHRLVASAFAERSNLDADQVNHKDGNKSNNSVDNLEWVTGRQNVQHALSTGLRSGRNVAGEKHGMCKLNSEAIKVIRFMSSRGISQSLLSRIYNVTDENIWCIVHRKTWKHV